MYQVVDALSCVELEQTNGLTKASQRSGYHLLDNTIVEQIINEDAMMLCEFLHDMRPPPDNEDDNLNSDDNLIDMKQGLKDSNILGFLTGQFVQTSFEKVEINRKFIEKEFDDDIITY